MFKEFNQKSWRSGLEPITAELHLCKCIQQAERVIYIITVFHEMISIIHIFEVILCFFFGHTILLPKFYDVFLEVAEKLFFRDTAYIGKSIVYGNIHQVI